MLGDGNIYHLVSIHHFGIEQPFLQGDTVKFNVPEPSFVNVLHLTSGILNSLLYPALYIASSRVIDCPVKDLYLFKVIPGPTISF